MNYALVFAAQQARSAITEDGPWTGKDWYNEDAMMGVANGIPYSNDTETQRRITAPLSVDGSIDNYLNFTNVQLVESILPESQWSIAFPYANSFYTYDAFLRGVAEFPAFCNETNLGQTLELSCKKELATIFAHMG